MKIKWKEDYSAKTQRLWGVVIGFFSGVILTTAALGVLWEWGVLKGAKWWEVMTAFGTVGAVTASVSIAYLLEEKRRKQARQDGAFLIAGERNRIGMLMASLYKIQKNDADLLQNDLAQEYTDIRNTAIEILTVLDSVQISVAANFDRVYAANLMVAKSQLHAVIPMHKSEFARVTASKAAIEKLNDCVQRTQRADEYIKRITRTA